MILVITCADFDGECCCACHLLSGVATILQPDGTEVSVCCNRWKATSVEWVRACERALERSLDRVAVELN